MKSVFTIIASVLIAVAANAQGMFINEFGNGAAGSKEFIETVVMGNPANPTAPVNLSGWIIDDNNGSFGTTGLAAGHMRIAAGCLTAVPPGSVIVFYNGADINAGIPAAPAAPDANDANGDGVYYIPSGSACLETCAGAPTATGASYTCPAAYTASTAANWTLTGFANGGDAPQVRRPDGTFFHGFSYGSMTAPSFPTFDAAVGGGTSFNAGAGGTGSTHRMGCGPLNAATSYTAATTGETAGASNSAANTIFLNNIKTGKIKTINTGGVITFDWSAACNCVAAGCPVLPISLKEFGVKANTNTNTITWTTATEQNNSHFDIERSTNGVNFEKIGTVKGNGTTTQAIQYSFVDARPAAGINYYRLRQTDYDGKFTVSHVVYAKINGAFSFAKSYPVPFDNLLNVEIVASNNTTATINIIDAMGKIVLTQATTLNSGTNTIALNTEILPKGVYSITLQNDRQTITTKVVK